MIKNFNFINSQEASVPYFINPTPGTYYVNNNVYTEVNIPDPNFYYYVIVTMTCQDYSYYAELYKDNPVSSFPVPRGYLGECVFKLTDSSQSIIYDTVTITLVPNILFYSPGNGALISAGTSPTIKLELVPSTLPPEPSYNVTLMCPNFPNVYVISNSTSVIFPISSERYGYCQFSAKSQNAQSSSPLDVIVTQSISLLSPVSGESYSSSLPTINVQYITLGNTSLSGGTVSANFTCGSLTQITNFKVNPNQADVPYTYPSGANGICYLTVKSASPEYLAFSKTPVMFSLKSTSTVEFSSPQGIQNVNAGSDLEIQLSSTPAIDTFGVTLDCNNPSLDPVSLSIPSNTSMAQDFPIPTNYYGNNCTMSIISPLNTFIPTNNLTLNIYQPINVTLISSSSTLPVNSNIQLKLQAVVQLDLELTLVQVCGSNTTNYLVNSVNSIIEITPPLNYAGSCTFLSLANGLYTASQVNQTVILKQSYQILSPANNTLISANSAISI